MLNKFIAIVMLGLALASPTYAKDECVSFSKVVEMTELPTTAIRLKDGSGYVAIWRYFSDNRVVAMTFDIRECFTGNYQIMTIEEYINLGPVQGKLFT